MGKRKYTDQETELDFLIQHNDRGNIEKLFRLTELDSINRAPVQNNPIFMSLRHGKYHLALQFFEWGVTLRPNNINTAQAFLGQENWTKERMCSRY